MPNVHQFPLRTLRTSFLMAKSNDEAFVIFFYFLRFKWNIFFFHPAVVGTNANGTVGFLAQLCFFIGPRAYGTEK